MPGDSATLSGSEGRDSLGRRLPSTPRCGAKTRTGKRQPCRLPAGFRTSHVGHGRCFLHGGRTASHRLHAERQQAQEFTQAALGKVLRIDALSAQELSVALAHGLVEHWRGKLALEGDHPSASTVQSFRLAVSDLSKISGRAIDSRVADRQIALAERAADEMVAVCEQGLAALIEAGAQITNAQRSAYAAGIRDALRGLEPEPTDVEVIALPGSGALR